METEPRLAHKVFEHHRLGRDDAAGAHHSVVQHDGAHADEHVVGHGAAVHQRPVPDAHPAADSERRPLVGAVQHGPVLHEAVGRNGGMNAVNGPGVVLPKNWTD